METKYPEIEVTLVGTDGNVFSILGKVQRELRRAGLSKEEIGNYVDEATSGDYDNALMVTCQWVSVN